MTHELRFTLTGKGQPMVICKCGMSIFNNGYSDAQWHKLRGEFVELHTDPFWYFGMESVDYGREEFGPYLSKDKAREGMERLQDMARKLNDGVDRWYSELYTKESKDAS